MGGGRPHPQGAPRVRDRSRRHEGWNSLEKSSETRIELGRRGEEAAVRYLLGEGFQIISRGYRFGRGEIDVIARDGPILVFLEVKTRTDPDRGFPEEAVTPGKRRQIRKIALGYLIENPEFIENPCRFDVLAVEFEDGHPLVRHIRDAF
ncbi:MAG: YraN family protein [Candidatus Aminicenantales bacterium]